MRTLEANLMLLALVCAAGALIKMRQPRAIVKGFFGGVRYSRLRVELPWINRFQEKILVESA